MRKLLFLFLFGGLATAFSHFKINQIINEPILIDPPISVLINKGEGLDSVATKLKDNEIISSADYFIIYSKFTRLFPKVKAGEYRFSGAMSLKNVADLITSGKVYLRSVTFAEGLTSMEIASILKDNEFLNGDFSIPNDGEILPETYSFTRGDSRQKLLQTAKISMEKFLDKAWNERDEDLPLKNKQEILVLASIVEKETGVATERPQVASVFINRLRKGMLLQTDPTVIYAITMGKSELNRALTKKDLQVDSPYNTYKYTGLPPSPICNPGKASIMAVAHPDKTPYIFFVASGNGGHNFAVSLKEHNENVRKWRALNKN